MKQNKVKPSSPEYTQQELIHRWRIVEFQTFYRKYRGVLAPCKPIVSSSDIYFNSYKEAEDYYNSHYGYNHWVQSCQDTWHKAYYEIIDDHSAILRYTDSDNYRIISWSICDFYEDTNQYNKGYNIG